MIAGDESRAKRASSKQQAIKQSSSCPLKDARGEIPRPGQIQQATGEDQPSRHDDPVNDPECSIG